jgi:hypothetical protein
MLGCAQAGSNTPKIAVKEITGLRKTAKRNEAFLPYPG